MHRTIVAALLAIACAIVMTEPTQSAPGKAPAAKDVTLTGCLQAEGTRYVLTDLHGVNAPASRSWKTAFLKKSSKHIEVVGATPALKLKDHVGHQVTVTGTSSGNWRVRARSVKQISASCS